jgi:type IV pilus assembly protein PilO
MFDRIEDLYDDFREKLFEKLPYDSLLPVNVKLRWGIVVIAPLIVLLLFYTLFIQTTANETLDLRERLESTRQDNEISRRIEKKLPLLKKQIEKLDDHLEIITSQLPEKKEIPDLLIQVSNIGISAGLEFQTFKPVEEVERDFYAEVMVELKLVGSFHNVITFFDQISRMPRILTISDLEIKEYAEKKEKGSTEVTVAAKCNVITYRFIAEKIDAKKEPEKKG